MNKKIIFGTSLFLSICLVSCSSNSDNYIKCSTVKIYDQKEFNNSEPVKIKIALYQCDEFLDEAITTAYGINKDLIFISLPLGSNDYFSSIVKFQYISRLGEYLTCNATRVSEIGQFSNYNEVYYSPSIRRIKYTEVQGEVIYISDPSYYEFLMDSPKNIYKYNFKQNMIYGDICDYRFNQEVTTTYIDVGDATVSYVIYTEPIQKLISEN